VFKRLQKHALEERKTARVEVWLEIRVREQEAQEEEEAAAREQIDARMVQAEQLRQEYMTAVRIMK